MITKCVESVSANAMDRFGTRNINDGYYADSVGLYEMAFDFNLMVIKVTEKLENPT